jgi:hypothetical protein
MALDHLGIRMAITYFGDGAELLFDDIHELGRSVNEAQKAVNAGSNWAAVKATGGDFNAIIGLTQAPEATPGRYTDLIELATGTSGEFSETEAATLNALFSDPNSKFLLEQIIGLGSREEQLGGLRAAIGADPNVRPKATTPPPGDSGSPPVAATYANGTVILTAKTRTDANGVTTTQNFNSLDEPVGEPRILNQNTPPGGGSDTLPGQNDNGSGGGLTGYIEIMGNRVKISDIQPMMDAMEVDIDEMRDLDMNNPEDIESLFPPDMVANHMMRGVDGATVIFNPQGGAFGHYYAEVGGIFGSNVGLGELNPDSAKKVRAKIGDNLFNHIINNPLPVQNDTRSLVVNFDGEVITQGHLDGMAGVTPDSFFYDASMDLNNDGVIDMADTIQRGRILAGEDNKLDPTDDEIIQYVNDSGTTFQQYIDGGLNGFFNSKAPIGLDEDGNPKQFWGFGSNTGQGPTDDDLRIGDVVLNEGGGYISGQAHAPEQRHVRKEGEGVAVFTPDVDRVINRLRREGLSDDEITIRLRGDGFTDQAILNGFSVAINTGNQTDTGADGLPLQSPGEMFRENLKAVRDAPVRNLPFIGEVGVAPVKKKVADSNAAITAINEGLKTRAQGLEAQGNRAFTPFNPSLPEDAFGKAREGLAGQSRKSLNTLATELGIQGTGSLSDDALAFTVASRQASSPSEVFGGVTPRQTPTALPTEAPSAS